MTERPLTLLSGVDKIGGMRKERRDGAALTAAAPLRLYRVCVGSQCCTIYRVCVGRQCCTITFLSLSSDLVYDRRVSGTAAVGARFRFACLCLLAVRGSRGTASWSCVCDYNEPWFNAANKPVVGHACMITPNNCLCVSLLWRGHGSV
jgi:hypothetical protein